MKENTPIRILQVTIGDGSFGGVANFLYTFYSHMDHDKVHSDFLYCGENSMKSKASDTELINSSITTFHILKRNNNGFKEYKKLLPALKQFFNQNNYDIVHINSSNLFMNVCVAYALKGRAKLISHSHNTHSTIEYTKGIKKVIKDFIRKPCQRYLIRKTDAMLACSNAAGVNLFGTEGVRNTKFKVINNAINAARYDYNEETRLRLRKENEDSFIVGFVGRLTDQKNPLVAIDIFREIRKQKENAIMWMIGEGELEEQIQKRIKDDGLQDSVFLLGRRSDIPDLMQGMDIFLAPSLYEGLPIVCVEAQAAALPVYASEVIPEEADITDLITRISLNKSPVEWADMVISSMKNIPVRQSTLRKVVSAGFEINEEAKKLENIYLSIIQ